MILALRAAAFVAVAFGVLTLSFGARVLFGDGAAAAGQYVPFIVWFNRGAGLCQPEARAAGGRSTVTARPLPPGAAA